MLVLLIRCIAIVDATRTYATCQGASTLRQVGPLAFAPIQPHQAAASLQLMWLWGCCHQGATLNPRLYTRFYVPIPIHKYTLLSRLTSSPMAVEKQTWLAKTAQPNQQVGKLARSLQHQGHNTMRRHGIPGIQSNQLDLQFLHMIARDYTLQKCSVCRPR